MQYGDQNLKNLLYEYFRMKFVFKDPEKFLVRSFIEIRRFYEFFEILNQRPFSILKFRPQIRNQRSIKLRDTEINVIQHVH